MLGDDLITSRRRIDINLFLRALRKYSHGEFGIKVRHQRLFDELG